MKISDLLTPERVSIGDKISSKKKAIERAAELISASSGCDQEKTFQAFFERERLGSTALGKGIAIPHGRTECCESPVAACLLLDEGIDFDACDGQPVQLIFAILVPHQAEEQHLKCLAKIAHILSDDKILAKIHHAFNAESLFNILMESDIELAQD